MVPLVLVLSGAVGRLSAGPAVEPIHSVAAIRALSREDAAKALPVKLTGVVTYQGWENFVIHDGQASIFADFRFSKAKGLWQGQFPNIEELAPGAGVEIEGVTDPGGFSPMVLVTRYRRIGAQTIPPPLRPALEKLLSGSANSQWVEVEGESWQARLGRWFEGNVCDVWVLKDYARDPSLYAEMRLRETLAASEARDEETFGRWMDYYAAHRVVAVHGGLVAMRRRDGANWLRIDEIAQSYGKDLGNAILAGFEARDFLAAREDDAALLAAVPRLAPDCRLHQEHRWGEGGWQPQPMRLEQREGLRRGLNLDPNVAVFLSSFDGRRTVREALAEVAAEADAEPAQVQIEVLRVVRRMIDLGFLLAPSP